jgi:hypothetical protein
LKIKTTTRAARGRSSTLTAVRAFNPARSRASLIAASLIASETFSSIANLSSSRATIGRVFGALARLGFHGWAESNDRLRVQLR